MTGRDLILYILKNNLEDENVFTNGSFLGFMTVEQAASKMNVGVATVNAWITMGVIDYVKVGDLYLVPATYDSILKIIDGQKTIL